MKLYFSLFLLVFAISSCKTQKALTEDSLVNQVPVSETYAIMNMLSADDMAGRFPGTPQYDKAVNYCIDLLKAAGAKPLFNGDFRDTIVHRERTSYNVVGYLPSSQPSDEYVLLGAHLDHIGISKTGQDTIFNGANDDASGVTAVLQIAKALQHQKLNKNVIFALFTEEESGLVGSKMLAERMQKEAIKVSYMINFEMLGTVLTTGEGKVYLTGYELSNMADLMNATQPTPWVENLPAATTYRLFNRSDNFPFYNTLKIPAQTLSSFDFENYEYYHKVEDEVKNLNLENMNTIIRKSAWMVFKMVNGASNPVMKAGSN